MAKDRRFDMRLAEDELCLFRAAATREGLKLAEWLRQAGLARVCTAEYKEPARSLGTEVESAPVALPSVPSSSDTCTRCGRLDEQHMIVNGARWCL